MPAQNPQKQSLKMVLRFPLFVMREFWVLGLQLRRIEDKLDSNNAKLNRVLQMESQQEKRDIQMSQGFEDVKARVERNSDITQSAISLITGLADQIRSSVGNEAALHALADKLESDQTALANAVTANTPFTPSGNAPTSN